MWISQDLLCSYETVRWDKKMYKSKKGVNITNFELLQWEMRIDGWGAVKRSTRKSMKKKINKIVTSSFYFSPQNFYIVSHRTVDNAPGPNLTVVADD